MVRTMNDWFEAEQRIERAQQLSESFRWAEALAEIDAALAINPHNATWHAQRGGILEELDRIEDAAEAYRVSFSLDADDRDVAVALGMVLARLGRLANALEIFDQLAKTYPDFEPAYCHRIYVYTELGRHEQAEEMFYLAQELDDVCPHCFFNVGISLLARGQVDRAIYCWKRVLELDSNYYGVNRRIGQAYRTRGQLDRAKEYYLRELRNDAGNTDLLFDLAELTAESGRLAMAAAKFAQIVELDPEHLEARFALGKIWLLRRRLTEAVECFQAIERTISGEPELPEFQWRFGEALFQLKRYEEATRRLQTAADQQTGNAVVLLLLGNCHLANRNPAKAADAFRRVLAIDARNAYAHHNLGVCLFQVGRQEAGLKHCLEAVRFKPDYVVAMHNAAVAYVQMGEWRQARSMLARALRADPKNDAARKLRSKLWRLRVRFILRKIQTILRLAPKTSST